MPPRYAIYYAPEQGSSLESFGNRWLGRSAETDESIEPMELPGMSCEDVRRITSAPRHYGFHGTLVPPFVLSDDLTPVHLIHHIKSFASEQQSFDLEPLSVDSVGSFIALIPAGQENVAHLAESCLRSLQPFRKQPTLAEMERRRAKGLTPNQERLLSEWWYPYVLDEYRFHITLTDSMPHREQRETVLKKLTQQTTTIVKERHPVRELCLFRQADTDRPFTIIQRLPLGSS